MKSEAVKYPDSLIMMKRCLLLSKRNPDTFLTSIIMPFLMMVLFVALFGKLIHPENISYVNYIIPGVLLQCFGQCASVTAVSVNRDITGGMISRFSTLPIKRISVLGGHVLESTVRNFLTAAVVLIAAVFLGFRPSAGPGEWLLILVLMLGVILTFSWLSVFICLNLPFGPYLHSAGAGHKSESSILCRSSYLPQSTSNPYHDQGDAILPAAT